MILEDIKSPKCLKKLNKSQYSVLCDQIRKELIKNVLKTGGHLASNLGVVELTLGVHLVFDTPKDKLIFDVGHQCYVHKMLTGRYEKMSTLRQFGGISGFPKPNESEYDTSIAGHAGTSISTALGIARSRDLKKEDYNVIAFLGDGSLGNGMIYEAMNDAGEEKTKIIVILNDNEMSIEKNVGGMSEYLSRLRTTKGYKNTKNNLSNVLDKMGALGSGMKKTLKKIKNGLKYSAISNVLFENLGFTYIGIIDGHNIESIVDALSIAKEAQGPVIIHAFTKKGMGYIEAEQQPELFHGVKRTNTIVKRSNIDYSSSMGNILCNIADKNKNVAAITAAMASGCGLTGFKEKFPKRFFDVGIAEEHAVTMAAGLAIGKMIPVVCIYSTFLQRAYDQIIHDVCLPNLHVVFCVDRSGIVGDDGETHQGIFDTSYLSHIPNMTILAPTCYREFEQMLSYAINEMDSPVAIKYPRGEISLNEPKNDFEFGKSSVVELGNDLTIVSAGNMLNTAIEASKILKENGLSATVINALTLRPLDKKTIMSHTEKYLFTIEDNLISGGFGESVKSNCDFGRYVKIKNYGWDDKFVAHGKPDLLYKDSKLDAKSIAKDIIDTVKGEI